MLFLEEEVKSSHLDYVYKLKKLTRRFDDILCSSNSTASLICFFLILSLFIYLFIFYSILLADEA